MRNRYRQISTALRDDLDFWIIFVLLGIGIAYLYGGGVAWVITTLFFPVNAFVAAVFMAFCLGFPAIFTIGRVIEWLWIPRMRTAAVACTLFLYAAGWVGLGIVWQVKEPLAFLDESQASIHSLCTFTWNNSSMISN